MITGSGFGASRLPQNLEAGQREQGHPILGVRGQPRKCRRDDSKTMRRTTPTVVNNDQRVEAEPQPPTGPVGPTTRSRIAPTVERTSGAVVDSSAVSGIRLRHLPQYPIASKKL